MRQKNRARCFINEEYRCLLLTNLKVGFSGLNKYLPPDFKRLTNKSNALRKKLTSANIRRKILIWRHPDERFMSYYYHWYYKRPNHFGSFGNNPHFNHLRQFAHPAFTKDFMNMPPKERIREEVIKQYCHYFPMFFMNDQHTTPQILLLYNINILPEQITDFVNLKEASHFLWDNFNISLLNENLSGRPAMIPDCVSDMCKVLYAEDYDKLVLPRSVKPQ